MKTQVQDTEVKYITMKISDDVTINILYYLSKKIDTDTIERIYYFNRAKNIFLKNNLIKKYRVKTE